MSANNAVYVLPVTEISPAGYVNGKPVGCHETTSYLVWEGDVDQTGEFLKKGHMTKSFLWSILLEGGKILYSQKAAMARAQELADQIHTLEYGIMTPPARLLKRVKKAT